MPRSLAQGSGSPHELAKNSAIGSHEREQRHRGAEGACREPRELLEDRVLLDAEEAGALDGLEPVRVLELHPALVGV